MQGRVKERPANRLIDESSPYLRQHAHNPVDWFAWGDVALDRACAQDKPILLSIGYSACHWCHVMERESFEDPDIAQLMNENFINIKVDREERPDIDQIYQLVVQLMGRSGGWPLTVFLLPNRQPFFGGTYFPPTSRYGKAGFPTILKAVADAYQTRRAELHRTAGELLQSIRHVVEVTEQGSEIPRDVLASRARALLQRVDQEYGGFGTAPKFPNPHALDVFLRASMGAESDVLPYIEVLRKTLDAMQNGGVCDQLGGGFHRYSTDAAWQVPHFEKMLYDNALLSRLYVEGFRRFSDPSYCATATATLHYVLREMRSPEGAFFSSQDADSEGGEGAFFVWNPQQLAEVLPETEHALAESYFGVNDAGNFEDGMTVLHKPLSIESLAQQYHLSIADMQSRLESIRSRLMDARTQRPAPLRDDKIITAWNGLMISAFAEAGGAFGDDRLVEAATQALRFIEQKLWANGQLYRIYKDGVAKVPAFLEDYGSIANAALDVYENTLQRSCINFAERVVERAVSQFWNEERHAFLFSTHKTELIAELTDFYDNPTPSGTSLMSQALLRLHAYKGEPRYEHIADLALRTLAARMTEDGFGFGHALCSMHFYTQGPTILLLAGDSQHETAQAMLRLLREAYIPHRVTLRVQDQTQAELEQRGLTFENLRTDQDSPATFICANHTCLPAAKTVEALQKQLDMLVQTSRT